MTLHTVVAAVWILSSAGGQAAATAAQAQAGPAGHWEGAIHIPGQELQVEIDLADRTAGKWEGTISIPSQSLKGFPLSGITVQGTAVSFVMKGVPGEPQFKGVLSKDGKALTGDFSQGGMTTTFSLAWKGDAKFVPPPKSTAIAKELEGSWEGSINVDGTILRLALKLASEGSVGKGTLVSIDQGNAEIPITAITQTGAHVNLTVTMVTGTYDGDLKDGQLVGTWTQGPRSFPLTFKRAK